MDNDYKPIPPFNRFVLQNFPFIEDDFDALNTYQLLCKIVDYLNKVINAQNELGESQEALITAFNQLKDYVDHYFDNLDVQEEINNKLDDMAESGELEEIISTYLQSNVAWTFDTVADMKSATNLVAGSYAQTLGFHTLNDGGGAIYKIDDSGTANEKDVIAVGDLYAILIKSDKVNVKQLGAYGDNDHDDEDVINYAINYGFANGIYDIYLPRGTYAISECLVMPQYVKLYGDNRHNTKIVRTTNTPDIEFGVDAVVIFRQSNDFQYAYNHSQKIINITLSGNENTTYGIYALKQVPYTRIDSCIIESVNKGICYLQGGWLFGLYNLNIRPRQDGIITRSDKTSTTFTIDSVYVYGGSGIAYDLKAINYSEFYNIACDMNTGTAYKFDYCRCVINGFGCECAGANNAIIATHANVKINSGTIIMNDAQTYTCVDAANSTVLLSNINFTDASNNASMSGTFLNQHTNSYITLENCSMSKPFTSANVNNAATNIVRVRNNSEEYSVNTFSKFTGLAKMTSAGNDFLEKSKLNIQSSGIFSNVKGNPRYAMDGTDRRYQRAYDLGDLFINSIPELNGLAMLQQTSERGNESLAGTITATNISGTSGTITLSSLDLNADAVAKGIRLRTGRIIDSSSGGKANISSIDFSNNTVSLSSISGTFAVNDTLTFEGTTDFQRAQFTGIQLVGSGVTALRPSSPVAGLMYFDTTLGKPVWYSGSKWVDATGADA